MLMCVAEAHSFSLLYYKQIHENDYPFFLVMVQVYICLYQCLYQSVLLSKQIVTKISWHRISISHVSAGMALLISAEFIHTSIGHLGGF